MLYRTAEDFLARRGKYFYGRRGTPTSEALSKAIQEIEGPACAGVALLPSGLSAISTALLSILKAGDHVLVTDNCYGPARKFCDSVLKRFGVETTYFDPAIGGGIAALMQPNTKRVFCEAPGSLTFEMQDIPAIAAVAHARGALVLMDNTWASPLYYRALEKGVDVSIQSATKYIGGHSDLMMGTVSASEQAWPQLKDTVFADRTLRRPGRYEHGDARLAHAQRPPRPPSQSGLEVARWLEQRPEVLRVLHPALPGAPGHDIWKRDFTGACGLFAVVFKPVPEKALLAFLNALTLYGMGASWGGFESLAIPYDVTPYRSATKWAPGGPCVRLHIGLEDVGDLIADLERGLAAMVAAK